jgi:hypothetical protein
VEIKRGIVEERAETCEKALRLIDVALQDGDIMDATKIIKEYLGSNG